MPAYAQLVAKAMDGADDFKIRTCDFFDPKAGASMRRHHLWRLRHARSFFEQYPSDLYHLLDGSMAGFLPSKVWKKTVVTVHDLIPLLQIKGQLSGRPGLMGRFLIHHGVQALRHVAGLLADSDATSRDLLKFTDRSDVANIPVPLRPLPEPDQDLRLPECFLFHIGNNAAYKNRKGVLDVFARLQEMDNLHLILAGPEPEPQLRDLAATLERVEFRVNVSDAELSSLYGNASAFLFPSLYEGFGMPILEAMAAGCPVVCSDAASLPEVAGDAALIAAPDDIESLANHCRTLLQNPTIRDDLILLGNQRATLFNIERFSSELRAFYTTSFSRTGVSK